MKGAVSRWFREFGAGTFGAWDFKVAAACGLAAGLLSLVADVRRDATTVLLASAGVDVALTATILAALAIFTTSFDSAYRLVLEAAGGVRRALMPYTVVACAAAVGTLVALMAALGSPDLTKWPDAVVIAVSMLLTSWSILGTASLVELTHFHATQRAQLMRGADNAEVIRAQRVRAPHGGP